MKKSILLSAVCMAMAIITTSCSSDPTDYLEDDANEEKLTLTVTAESEFTLNTLPDEHNAKSYRKWESGDKLLLVTTNGSRMKVSTLTLTSTKRDGVSGEFTGSIPISRIVSGNVYRFFYMGKNTISKEELAAGKLNIDLSKQPGSINGLKNNCVWSGLGKIVVSGANANVEGSITLENAFSVVHFAMSTDDGTDITRVGMRGEGVYTAATIDLASGKATGTTATSAEVDPEENVFFDEGATNFCAILVPGRTSLIFDAYYDGSYSDVVTKVPKARSYPEAESFVYYNGHKATFSVSSTHKVAITNGNMQYVMPMTTYNTRMMEKVMNANTLIQSKNDKPFKITGRYTIHPGYYRLAPEQWEMAMPKNKRRENGTYTYETVKKDGKEYISPKTYRYFDLPSWGMIDNPTLLSTTGYFRPGGSASGIETQYDFGNKLYVGTEKTRTMTSDEWDYLLPKTTTTVTDRIWVSGSTKIPKWSKCYIDENGNGTRNPGEQRGYIVFPDEMTLDKAKKVFTPSNPIFGTGSNMTKNATTYDKIKNSGVVFIPLAAYRPAGNKTISQWGNHGNYFTSSYQGSGIIHVRLVQGTYVNPDPSAPGQGCMSRLVQNIN